MANVSIGKKAPDFSVAATGGQMVSLKDFRGKNVIIYFYPKDSTPGCTLEGQDFRDNLAKFKRQKTVVFGVSCDSLSSHERFREKQGLKFDLLSDPDEKLCNLFDVIREQNMYGRKFIGIERSTFLFDQLGVLRQEWRKVRVKGHVAEVLDAVKAL